MSRSARILLVAVAALAMTATVASPAVAGAGQRRCVERSGIVVANAQAVVLRRDGSFFACDVRSRRLRSLGEAPNPDSGGTRLVRLAGRYVGYYRQVCNSGGCGTGAFLVDVSTGRRRIFNEPEDAGEALGLQVTAAGSIAWVRHRQTPGDVRYEVIAARRDSAPVVLEAGPREQFVTGSLAFAGGRLYWSAQGRPASALLP